MVSVAAFTGNASAATARFRIRQYIPVLASMGIAVRDFMSALGTYPPQRHWLRPAWTVAAVLSRLPSAAASFRYDVSFLQREMVSTLYTVERLTKKPRLLDLDDAVWLNRRGHNLEALARDVTAVICGNDFIADWAAKQNRRIYTLPTPVDTDRFQPGDRPSDTERERIVIGWMGQSSGYEYLDSIAGALHYVLDKYPQVAIELVCDRPPRSPELQRDRILFMTWSAEAEVELLRRMDIGLMPLKDDSWCRGKCSYKMLLYMSCRIPVVVSDVGMNSEVLRRGQVGFGAHTADDWISALEQLIEDRRLRVELGRTGREVVEEHYSVRKLAPRLAAILEEYSQC
jgi:glycosyltransferase involved in cell wall biosynthesis